MRISVLFVFSQLLWLTVKSQNSRETIIAGSRVIIELITMLQKNRPAGAFLQDKKGIADSCAIKLKSDVCFKNSTQRDLTISIMKRTENAYDPVVFSVKVITKKKECLFELQSGIYKYRIEADEGTAKILVSEGEFRLQPCDNMLREIK